MCYDLRIPLATTCHPVANAIRLWWVTLEVPLCIERDSTEAYYQMVQTTHVTAIYHAVSPRIRQWGIRFPGRLTIIISTLQRRQTSTPNSPLLPLIFLESGGWWPRRGLVVKWFSGFWAKKLTGSSN